MSIERIELFVDEHHTYSRIIISSGSDIPINLHLPLFAGWLIYEQFHHPTESSISSLNIDHSSQITTIPKLEFRPNSGGFPYCSLPSGVTTNRREKVTICPALGSPTFSRCATCLRRTGAIKAATRNLGNG